MNGVSEGTVLPILDFNINMGDHMGNHAVLPYSVTDNGNEYIIWIYDSNYNEPQKMTISKDYKNITYRGDSKVTINDIITNPDVININTYTSGLLPSDTSNISLTSEEQYDFTTLFIDTSSGVTITNDKNQSLTVKGDEIVSGDIEVLDISHPADMNEDFALIVLKNDSSGKQNLKIQSNANNEIIAVINNNHNVGFIHTTGDSHTAEYSSDSGVSVVSTGKVNGEISYSNPTLVKNTDVFGIEMSGTDASNMSIKSNEGSVRVDSDNRSNMKLSATRHNDEYYETDFSLSNTEHSSNNAEISELNNDAVLNIDTDNDGTYDETYSPIWNITPLSDITPGDEISAVANIDVPNCELILALYSADGKLINVSAQSCTSIDAKKEVRMAVPENITLSGCKLKAMIWEGIDNMKPIVDTTELAL